MVTKYPLLPRAIPLALGIAAAGLSGIYALLIVGGFVIAAGAFRKRVSVLHVVAWFTLGAAILITRMSWHGPEDLRVIFGNDPELVTIRGFVTGEPEQRILDQDQKTRYRTTARVRVEEVLQKNNKAPARGEVAVATIGFLNEDFVAGCHVEITGVLTRPQGASVPGLFDFERYLKWQRIFCVLRVEDTNDWKLLKSPERWTMAGFYRGFNGWAQRTLQRGIPDDENSRLLRAMALGWRPGLTNEVSEPFTRTGTLHVFAISGLHIALVAALLVKALGWAGFSRKLAGVVALPLIWFYTGATGGQASAIRSAIMVSVVIVGWILRRPNNLLNSLAASAILILLWQPEQLFQPGFQLSFLLLIAIAIWPALSTPPWPDPTRHLGQHNPEKPNKFEPQIKVDKWGRKLAELYEWITGRDPFLPDDLRPRWRRELDKPAAWILGGLNLSAASLLCSAPIIAAYFNIISASSIIANLIVVPLSAIALYSALGSLLTAWLPFVPAVFNLAAWAAMDLMVTTCRFFEKWPYSFWYVKSPGVLFVLGYYAVLGLVRYGFIWNKRVQIGVGICSSVFLAAALWKESTTTTVVALPGSGVVFVDAPWNDNDFLIDCGREREAMSVVKPFLRSRGVDRLDTIVLTHGDITHVEGYHRLADDFQVKRTVTSGAKSRSPAYRQIIRRLEADPEKWKKAAAGDQLGVWRILHPLPGDDFAKADDEALVFFGKVGGKQVLLLSDLGRLGQDRLAERAPEADIVICGLSVPEVLRPALREKVKPKTIVLTGYVLKMPELEDVQLLTTQKAFVLSSNPF